jgi:hypothetical protein
MISKSTRRGMAALDRSVMGDLHAHATPLDGSCFFHAIRMCLSNYRGDGRANLRSRLRAVGVPEGEPLTVHHLRFITYAAFLLQGADTDLWLSKWVMMFAVSPAEYGHVACVARKPLAEITDKDRVKLYQACMMNSTWGDEVALFVLELMLNIRIMVLVEGRLQTRPNLYGADFKPDLFLVVKLSHGHYEPVTWSSRGDAQYQWAFQEAELPPILIWLSNRDCHASDLPFVNLGHLWRREWGEAPGVAARGGSARKRKVPGGEDSEEGDGGGVGETFELSVSKVGADGGSGGGGGGGGEGKKSALESGTGSTLGSGTGTARSLMAQYLNAITLFEHE